MLFERTQVDELLQTLRQPYPAIQAIVGPRQVGKSTLIRQTLAKLDVPTVFLSCDAIQYRRTGWIKKEWEIARLLAKHHGVCVIALDDAQRLPGWAPILRWLHEEDIFQKRDIRIVITGSSELELTQQLNDKFTHQFNIIRAGYWSFAEMNAAFNWSVDQYLFYGGLPKSGDTPSDESTWSEWVRQLVFDFMLKEDVKAVSPSQNQGAIRDYFSVSSLQSGCITTYTELSKKLPQLIKPTTLLSYQKVLERAGISSGLVRMQDGGKLTKTSSPKLQLSSNAVFSAMLNQPFEIVRSKNALWKQTLKSGVGAHLLNFAAEGGYHIYYWFDRQFKIDFVLKKNQQYIPIVVAPSDTLQGHQAIDQFAKKNPTAYGLILDTANSEKSLYSLPMESFLRSVPSF